MEIHLEWGREVPIKYDLSLDRYVAELETIPDNPGIYIFGRTFSDKVEALYVGKANSLRNRIKQQFNNHTLMTHIENAKNGNRVIIYGVFHGKPGQSAKTCTQIAERALIRYYLAKNHNLANLQGTTINHHVIVSGGITKNRDLLREIQVEA